MQARLEPPYTGVLNATLSFDRLTDKTISFDLRTAYLEGKSLSSSIINSTEKSIEDSINAVFAEMSLLRIDDIDMGNEKQNTLIARGVFNPGEMGYNIISTVYGPSLVGQDPIDTARRLSSQSVMTRLTA